MTRALIRTATPGIYKRGDRYVVIVRDDQRRQVKRFAGTLAEARTLKAELTTKSARGTLDAGPAVTFAEYAERWMTSYRGRTSRGVREHTMADYRRSLRQYAIPFLGKLPLRRMHLRDIKAFAEMIADTGATQHTVRGYVGVVKIVLATAVEDGVIHHDPSTGFRNVYGKQSTARRKALTDAELEVALDELPARYQLLGRFLAETGVRIGEAAGLQWGDIDSIASRVNIERRYYRGTVDSPKTANGIRSIPISAEMLGTLRRHRFATRGRVNDLVFPSEAGTYIDSHVLLRRIFKPAFERAGVPWAGLHTMRHTCASRLFRSGWNAKQVQMVLGHHSPAFTMETYIHLIPEDLPELPASPVAGYEVPDLAYLRRLGEVRRLK